MKTGVDNNHINEQEKSPRLKPLIVMVVIQWIIRFVLPVFIPDAIAVGLFGSILLGLGVLIWWSFFSRIPRFERWGAVILMVVCLTCTSQLLHESIRTANMGMMFIIYSVPVMCLALVFWAIISRQWSVKIRLITMLITIIVASGFWTMMRTNGMTSNLHHDFEWRWAKTNEEKFIIRTANEKMSSPDNTESGFEWPGFRGASRDGILHGVRIVTDWKKSPPVELWRREIGPACSSFAISHGLLYSQEQRGDNEVVVCYNLSTGKPVWVHSDKARFWDSHAGAGPRSTPTIFKDRVYTLGATGILNVLNAKDGTVVWSRNAAKDTEVKIPGWGYTSSPLVLDSVVAVAIAGKILVYDSFTGNIKWSGADGGESYSSPHLMTIDGVQQIVFMNKSGITGFAPADGRELWKLARSGCPIDQPAQISGGDILISDPSDMGGKDMKRLTVTKGSNSWTVKEIWTSAAMRPYFNDFVVNKGFVYGFDGLSLACMNVENGKRQWRGGRDGGQMILIADQDLMLVLSEKGDLILVSASPDKLTELARMSAIKGKTWSHPAISGNIVVVRNTSEMVAYRLPSAD